MIFPITRLLKITEKPTNALDKESVEKFYKIIDDEKKRGATIIIASHILIRGEKYKLLYTFLRAFPSLNHI